ncbi:MAG: hypothetical protein A3E21_08975 [Sulfurimonas sp. RIFCSPHIGHO2_12_FULL_36_9]|uniref:hypothetical protein n=1 Tax=Sulfurimonas sp. RIFCSPLOWO2_12_36_12 TaxID=1802253 RepID=UPI0008AB6C2A|nr:hypothetical protein [Sulfurimonas sp. RIFCSPLOWO2_12_36_12]OHD97414.1 MAG: hypothetical protein A3J26_04080 [Sulfurimonas sp. RIFCSPLOWO2_02_FULL_36_28]OHD99651.1 MAG: hypothetical protein A3E21_08975 [Sulfurimonas sp. RIFCSPHIGHO2_12_FULL_36_9]OHE01972.1 MAG: hypothetical protein A2W82_01560 [Sulfurimonas sp. RIFCSPLOWO2_12_36_12]OHE05699.1 MAG: hypothetical protein A3K14_01395 [Sulfurimonas sp. RIFCSPLOWO2_12_FULL_36_74]
MLKISKSIKTLNESDIGDNLLHYDYNVKYLLSLIRKGISQDDQHFLSSYRSFEGEVFENFVYEKLLIYAAENDNIEKFVLKGFHQDKIKSHANTLSISEKQQIVYRTKSREISEFDAMLITKDKELYFVEMTLVKSVLKLRKRLRKKKALLEIIFPNYEIKALIILNEGATGVRQLPSYCTVWLTEEFSAKGVLDYIVDTDARKLLPKKRIKSDKMIEAHVLKLYPFRYYNTISWITKTIRSHKKYVLDMNFLMSQKVQRYHDLYNKFYIGYVDAAEVREELNLDKSLEDDHRVIVAIEKKHSDEITLTYYIQQTRKILYLYSYDDNNKIIREKKDPYGITITEVYHISKMMDEKYKLNASNLATIKKLLEETRTEA